MPLRLSAVEKYGGRNDKRGGAARADETRNGGMKDREEVEGNGDPYCRGFSQNQTNITL